MDGGIEDQAANYKVVLLSAVSGVLESAVDDKLIGDNPCKVSTIRRPTGGNDVVKEVWPEEPVKAIRGGMAERWRIAVTLGAGWGLRQGELLGLSPDDIDEQNMVVHSDGNFVRWVG